LDNLRRALVLNPTSEETHRLLGLVYAQQGQYDEAAASFREAVSNSETDLLSFAGLGQVAALRGHADEARAVLRELEERQRTRYVSPVAPAMIQLALGEVDASFDLLEKAHQDRRGWLTYLRIDPIFDPIRSDPRFAGLLQRMRLT
jgi:tetratricopeptide (TPR) repeat protein